MHERYLQSIRTEIKLVGKSNIDDMLQITYSFKGNGLVFKVLDS